MRCDATLGDDQYSVYVSNVGTRHLGYDGAVQPTVRDETWVWRQGQVQISLGFTDGVFSGTVFANQVDDTEWVTKSHRVQTGMTDQEVEQILGPTSEQRLHTLQSYIWTNANGGMITVNFEDGLSSGGRRQSGPWP